MEILIFFFVISNVNLVLTDDSAAIETTFRPQNTYKVHPEPEDAPQQSDQVAESSSSITQGSGQVRTQNYVQIPAEQSHYGQNTHQISQQYGVQVPEALRDDSQQQGYQPQHIYVQHYPLQPIRILGAEASPLQQSTQNQNQQTIGFSSYVEHVSPREEEEINSALKEGSVADIKRLVPKSGISFKIYHNEKDLKVESQQPEIQQNVVTHSQSKIPEVLSKLQYNVKPLATVAPFQVQTTHRQPTTVLESFDQTYVKAQQQQQQQQQQHHGFEKLPLLQNQQVVNTQQVYYTQQGVQPQKGFWEVDGKSSTPIKSQFNVNVGENYGKVVSSTEINSLSAGQSSTHGLADLGHLQYQNKWNYDSRSEGSEKVQNVKSVQVQYDPVVTTERSRGVVQFQYDPVSSTERTRGFSYAQIIANANTNRQKAQINAKSGINEQSNAFVSRGKQTNIGGYPTSKVYADQKPLPNRFAGYYTEKTAPSQTINHLGTNAYGDSETHKISHYTNSQISHSNLETAKGGHHVVAQTSQNNFDHQKALEGSTSFDIKNAIDNSGNSVHQTNYPQPTPDLHPLVDIQKQQLAYIVPKIPPSSVLIENSIHDSPVVEGHQVKHFGHEIYLPQQSYHAVPEVGGKYFQQPQTIIWSPEQFKHSLAADDLHQQVLNLHLPKDEYQYVKTPNVELPTSSISHIAYQQQKHPYVLHYDVPVVKYPQEVHYQLKTKTPLQNNQLKHIKVSQPNGMDWSWLKNMIPNFSGLSLKPDSTSYLQESGKKIVPILIRKRKNRSNSKQEVGVVYGKVNNNRRPAKPNKRQEKTVLVSLLPEASNNLNLYEAKGEKKNEFSVSASYKVDRSFKSS